MTKFMHRIKSTNSGLNEIVNLKLVANFAAFCIASPFEPNHKKKIFFQPQKLRSWQISDNTVEVGKIFIFELTL